MNASELCEFFDTFTRLPPGLKWLTMAKLVLSKAKSPNRPTMSAASLSYKARSSGRKEVDAGIARLGNRASIIEVVSFPHAGVVGSPTQKQMGYLERTLFNSIAVLLILEADEPLFVPRHHGMAKLGHNLNALFEAHALGKIDRRWKSRRLNGTQRPDMRRKPRFRGKQRKKKLCIQLAGRGFNRQQNVVIGSQDLSHSPEFTG